jgi:hypothetical protein
MMIAKVKKSGFGPGFVVNIDSEGKSYVVIIVGSICSISCHYTKSASWKARDAMVIRQLNPGKLFAKLEAFARKAIDAESQMAL